jgi:hypothetical protein
MTPSQDDNTAHRKSGGGGKQRSRLRKVGRRLLFRKNDGGGGDRERDTVTRSGRPSSSTPLSSSTSSYGAIGHEYLPQNKNYQDNDGEEASLPSLMEALRAQSNERQSSSSLPPTWMFWRSNRSDLQTITKVQSVLRYMVLLTGSFLLGVYYHGALNPDLFEKALEYSLVAWMTCFFLGILVALSSTHSSDHGPATTELDIPSSYDEEEGRSLLMQDSLNALNQHSNSNIGEEETPHLPRVLNGTSVTRSRSLSASETQQSISAITRTPFNVHPALDPFYIVDCQAIERVSPNSTENLYTMDTDYFSGHMMVLIRTPDVDDPSSPSLSPATRQKNAVAVQHLRGKHRRFEFQFQVRLKKIPQGTVYFSCDLTQPIKLGLVQRAFVSAAMKFVRSSNPSFHYSVQGSFDEIGGHKGDYERPHMAFPVQDGMNRVVVTPPGQTPPRLGTVVEEDDESLMRRKKGMSIEWDLDATYTFSLWSAYVDFLEWRVLNLPGIRPFGLNGVIGTQPIYLTLYEIDASKEKHNRSDMTMIVEFEMSNINVTGKPGPIAQKWQAKQSRKHVVQRTINIENKDDVYSVAQTPLGVDNFDDVDNPLAESMNSLDMEDTDAESSKADEGDGTNDQFGAEAIDAVAELGEGLYVRSGDSITLRDASDDRRVPSFLTMGGGFAVLQEQNSATIVIEKAGRSQRGKTGRSKLIKSGDTVMFKLITKDRKGMDETRYLSIHRGWWLKWVTTVPSNNGFFTIYTHQTEIDSKSLRDNPPEIQSSYLTLGGLFWLRHRRWSKFLVGVAAEESTTYGGRMLGLFTQHKVTKSNLPEEIFMSEDPMDDTNEKSEGKQREWLKPLGFRAYEALSDTIPNVPSSGLLSQSQADDRSADSLSPVYFSDEDFQLDAPIWVEMMNRTHRVSQLAYIVRARGQDLESQPDSFVMIRTGRDLAEIMRVGLNWRAKEMSLRKRKGSLESSSPVSSFSGTKRFGIPSSEQADESPDASVPASGRSLQRVAETEGGFETSAADNLEDSLLIEQQSDEEVSVTEEQKEERELGSTSPRKRKFMGKLAHTVKSKTASTGKAVVRSSVKVGKGTVSAGKAVGKGTMSAGKAILPIRSMNPPGREPSQKNQGQSKRLFERDLHVPVSRDMKRIEKMDSPVAGELAAPEQSARTVSSMLAKMSSLPRSSEMSKSFNDLLSSVIVKQLVQDDWFLQGGALELGVPHAGKAEGPLFESIVARCLWESHWREECCLVFSDSIKFYAPNAKDCAVELLFDDIRCIRELDKANEMPLPSFPILVVETAWMCQYVVFSNESKRELFRQVATRAKEYSVVNDRTKEVKELQNVRFWLGFKTESSLGQGKWADVASSGKIKPRTILNNRRMTFDLPPKDTNSNVFVEEMLKTALSFSLDSLLENPEDLIMLLDTTSYLRAFRLDELDFSSVSCFCLFVNIYHCLLQHALLLTINGPLKSSSCTHFMRTTCYEIGGDVFSLAELQQYLIRAGMSKATNARPPYIEAPKKSASYEYYALGYTSSRVHFLLNTGDMACPKAVIVLRPETLEEQLNFAATEFIRSNVKVDEGKRTIFVPKVCDVYRNDFGFDGSNAAYACLQYCLGFMSQSKAEEITGLLGNNYNFTVKFCPSSDQYHTYLTLQSLPVEGKSSDNYDS